MFIYQGGIFTHILMVYKSFDLLYMPSGDDVLNKTICLIAKFDEAVTVDLITDRNAFMKTLSVFLDNLIKMAESVRQRKMEL